MNYYYHNQAFGHESVTSAPEGAIMLSNEEHAEIFSRLSQGYAPGENEAGFPVATPPPARTLEEAKADACAALREKRKAVEYGGFEFQGQTWDSTEKDELRLNSMLKMFEMSDQKEFPGWKVADNIYITATPEIVQGAALALMTHYAKAFAVEAEKLAEIEALKTPGEVETWLATELASGW